MAKKTPKDQERRALVEKMRNEQQRKEKQRSMLILGGCIVVVLGLLSAALIPYLNGRAKDSEVRNTALDKLGVTPALADCDDVTTKSAEGSGDHKTIGTPIDYPEAPPAFGPHWPNFMQGAEIRTFYTPDDRPELERVVHSLEHGHTLIWYDDTVTEDSEAYEQLEDIATKLKNDPYVNIVPWKSTDGGEFPEGKHIALTHWTGPDDQQGAWQYCGKPSGKVIGDFDEKYPSDDAPEPGAA